MLGRLLMQKPQKHINGFLSAGYFGNGISPSKSGYSTPMEMPNGQTQHNWRSDFEEVPWVDPNSKNLVVEGDHTLVVYLKSYDLTYSQSQYLNPAYTPHPPREP